MHQARLRRTGTYDAGPMSPAPLAQRWERLVDRSGDCWLWQGHCNNKGYGTILIEKIGRRNRSGYAHRIAYELYVGAIPPGLNVLHECDNPPCVNPAHLHLGTPADNMREMYQRGRYPIGRTRSYRRLSDAQIIQMADRCRAGELRRDLAIEYGVSKSYGTALILRALKGEFGP